MYYLCLCLLLSPVTANNYTETANLNLKGIADGFEYFFMHYSDVMDSIKDIFNIIISDHPAGETQHSIDIPEDAYLNINNLTTKYGYPFEEHNVTTEDGYILTLHRIPAKDRSSEPIFLMHGLVDTSDSWIIQGPKNALAYILADKGYDIWMGNARGNKYSMAHKELKATEDQFWRFTWDEIGRNDLPAMIDYVLNVTQKSGVYYVGHSQGTTSFYVMTSLKPEYNAKIKMMYALAPVAWCKNIRSPMLRLFSPAYKILGYFLDGFNAYSPSTEFFNKFAMSFCSAIPSGCDSFLRLTIGNDFRLVNKTMLPILFGHIPSSSSTMQFMHYGQLVESKRFCRYDYGETENFNRYGSPTPPDYDLEKITVPISMFYGGNDWLSDRKDVEMLIRNLPNVISTDYTERFNHWDFLYANIAKDLIYMKIVEQIAACSKINRKNMKHLKHLTGPNEIFSLDTYAWCA